MEIQELIDDLKSQNITLFWDGLDLKWGNQDVRITGLIAQEVESASAHIQT